MLVLNPAAYACAYACVDSSSARGSNLPHLVTAATLVQLWKLGQARLHGCGNRAASLVVCALSQCLGDL